MLRIHEMVDPPTLMRSVRRLRRQIHQHPELGWEESETIKKVLEELKLASLVPLYPVGGVVCDITNTILPPDTPRIGFRADLDALPIQEDANCGWRSQNDGIMHACGHDCHTAMLLTAGTFLARHPEQLTRNVRLIFTQAEEIPPGGEPGLIKAGGTKGLAEVYGLHVITSAPELGGVLPTGTFATRQGNITAHSDRITIRLETEGGHVIQLRERGSLTGVYAWWVQALETEILQPIPEALVHAATPTASTMAANILPSWLEFVISFRAADSESYAEAKSRLDGIVMLFRAIYADVTVTVDHKVGHVPTVNDESVSKTAVLAACDVERWVKTEDVIEVPRVWADCPQIMGGESFGRFRHDAGIPSNFMLLGAGGHTEAEQAVHGFGHHCPKFNPDERALPLGIAYWLSLATRPRD
ncbi:MAG: M20 family metallopeptidase [bacterium]|nr:M20 family metallopeptidase [bacterium]